MLGLGTSQKMEDVSVDDLDNINWDTDDEMEIFGTKDSLSSKFPINDSSHVTCNVEASSSAGSSNGMLIQQFVSMGFSEDWSLKQLRKLAKALLSHLYWRHS